MRSADRLRQCAPALVLALVAGLGLGVSGMLTRGFAAVTSDGVRRIDLAHTPRALAPIRMVDSAGHLFSLDAAQAGATLITLAYTSCVEICRTTASGQAYLQQELRARRLEGRAHLLTISFDPARDTPAVLRNYARKMGADPALWTFATVANPADLPRLLKLFDIVVLPDGMGGYVHNAAIFAADRRARLVAAYDADRPDQALADLLPD